MGSSSNARLMIKVSTFFFIFIREIYTLLKRLKSEKSTERTKNVNNNELYLNLLIKALVRFRLFGILAQSF